MSENEAVRDIASVRSMDCAVSSKPTQKLYKTFLKVVCCENDMTFECHK